VEQIVDQHGRMMRSPAALAALRAAVERDLGSMALAMSVQEQEWSASGGLHLVGTWRESDTPVLIKLGVNLNQLYWTRQIAATAPDLIPKLYASGEKLGDLQIGWTAMERIAFGPLGPAWNGQEFGMLLDAAVRFQRVTRAIEPRHAAVMDAARLRSLLEVGVAAHPPGPVAAVIDRLEADWAWVAATCEREVCHGDVHMCNVLTRTPPPDRGDALLIDCQPSMQPWAFDAAYPQILNSTDRSRVGYQGLVPQMARIRAGYGMSSCAGRDLDKLARITLAWYAIRLWGLTPDRHAIADYCAETEHYIRDGASVT
jgi:hypothetical protein